MFVLATAITGAEKCPVFFYLLYPHSQVHMLRELNLPPKIEFSVISASCEKEEGLFSVLRETELPRVNSVIWDIIYLMVVEVTTVTKTLTCTFASDNKFSLKLPRANSYLFFLFPPSLNNS